MKRLVLCDAAGNIASIAFPDPNYVGALHMEVEGGPVPRELEVDEDEILREDLLGRRGDAAEARALRKLRDLM